MKEEKENFLTETTREEKKLSTENKSLSPDNLVTHVIGTFNPGNNDLTQVKTKLNETTKEKRHYPAERKTAPQWKCPVCFKSMSSRGKAGHLEKVHGRSKVLKAEDLWFNICRSSGPKRRPLSRSDVRNLINNIFYLLLENTREPNIIKMRKAMLQCEYLIRELEIRNNCTLEEAWEKFPIQREEIGCFNR